MRLFLLVRAEVDRLVENSVRLTILGDRDHLPSAVRTAVEVVEEATAAGTRLHRASGHELFRSTGHFAGRCRLAPAPSHARAVFRGCCARLTMIRHPRPMWTC